MDLVTLVRLVRNVFDQSDKVLDIMSHNHDGENFDAVETLFGLPAGVAVKVDVVPSLAPEPAPGRKFRRLVSRIGPPPGSRRGETRREVQPLEV